VQIEKDIVPQKFSKRSPRWRRSRLLVAEIASCLRGGLGAESGLGPGFGVVWIDDLRTTLKLCNLA
jgi:hypothetical protein